MPYNAPPPTKILLCVLPEELDRLNRALDCHQLTFVRTRDEAMSLLRADGFGMVIIDLHFDESQMFNLLSDIRLHANYRHVPILIVFSRRRYLFSDVMIEATDHAIRAATANGLIDFEDFPDDEQGNARLKRIVDFLILIDGDLYHVAAEAGDPGLASIIERRMVERRGARR